MVIPTRRRILIVDDEEDVSLVLKARLGSVGYDVQTERYGATALNDVIQHPPDLILLDVKLPDLDGYEVCQELRRIYPSSRPVIVMFTVLEEPDDYARGFSNGADAYLVKGCEPNQLVKTITQLLSADRTMFATANEMFA